MMIAMADAMRAELAAIAEPERASAQQAYMKSAMPYRGVGLPGVRRTVSGVLRAVPGLTLDEVHALASELWDGAEFREDRYCAMQVLDWPKYRPVLDESTLVLVRRFVIEGAWWDITDELSGVVGWLLRFPHAKREVRRWADDEVMWLRRSAIIAQLHAQGDTDLDLLTYAIERNLADKEFFIRKAIGWALRDYSYHDAEWVKRFVAEHDLAPLSHREALKAINRRAASQLA